MHQQHAPKAARAQNGPLLKVTDGAGVILALLSAAGPAHQNLDLHLRGCWALHAPKWQSQREDTQLITSRSLCIWSMLAPVSPSSPARLSCTIRVRLIEIVESMIYKQLFCTAELPWFPVAWTSLTLSCLRFLLGSSSVCAPLRRPFHNFLLCSSPGFTRHTSPILNAAIRSLSLRHFFTEKSPLLA